MEARITAILTDERGWQKPYQLNEGVYWIGSADKVQIQLPVMKDISPYHLQVVNAHNSPSVRLINLSNGSIVVQKGPESTLFAPGGIMDVFGPEIFRLGTYTLHFQLQKQNESQPATTEGKQKVIGLRLVLPDIVLRPNIPLVSVLSLQNLGNQACQFRVEIEGIPAQCYEISPPPLIFAGGEESTEIRFFHQKVAPPAGQQMVTIRVSAPDVYKDEVATVHQVLKVMPYYGQSLSFSKPVEETIPTPDEYSVPAGPGVDAPIQVKETPVQSQEPVVQAKETPVQSQEPVIQATEPVVQVKGMPARAKGPPVRVRKPFVQVEEPPAQIEELPVQVEQPPVQVEQPPVQVEELPVQVKQPVEFAPEVLPEKAQIVSDRLPAPQPQPVDQPAPIQATPQEAVQPMADNFPAPAEVEQAQPEVEIVEPVEDTPTASPLMRKQKRPDLSSVKVMKASSGDFLEKRSDQE